MITPPNGETVMLSGPSGVVVLVGVVAKCSLSVEGVRARVEEPHLAVVRAALPSVGCAKEEMK